MAQAARSVVRGARWRLFAIAATTLAACYAPDAQSGAPCTPALDNCPTGQQCVLVGGEHRCTTGSDPADGPTTDAAGRDTPDPPVIDAMVDAPTPTARWSLVQTRANQTSNLAIQPTQQGNLVIVAVQTNGLVGVTDVTDERTSVYLPVPNSRTVHAAANLGVELWYTKSVGSNVKRISATGSVVLAMVMWEVANMDPVDPLVATAKLDNQNSSIIPVGAPVATSAAGQFVISIAIVESVLSGIRQGNEFTNDHLTHGNGWAHLTSDQSPAGVHQAQWEQPSNGRYCATTAAFRTR